MTQLRHQQRSFTSDDVDSRRPVRPLTGGATESQIMPLPRVHVTAAGARFLTVARRILTYTVLAILLLPTLLLCVAGSSDAVVALSRPLIVADELRPADAILVLGAGSYQSVFTDDSAYRLVHAIQLFKQGYAPKIILSGSTHIGTKISDADAMATFMVSVGVDPADLILDRAYSNVIGRASSVSAVAKRHGIKSVILVTSPANSYRALHTLRRVGGMTEVISAPGKSADRILIARDHFIYRVLDVTRAVYEYVAIAYYWYKGWI